MNFEKQTGYENEGMQQLGSKRQAKVSSPRVIAPNSNNAQQEQNDT
jgi:hypothetical protein